MTDVIHHEDGANSGLLVVLIIIVIAIGAFLLWRFMPTENGTTAEPGIQLNIIPGGSNSGSN